MGIIKKKRMEKQEACEEPEMVHIEDPSGTGQLILVRKSDLDEEGHLIEEEDGDVE